MVKKQQELMIPDEIIINKIYIVRGNKVIIDCDLADLYHVATGVLNQSIKRNKARFPDDFMFRLTEEELKNLKS